jgi:F-type H+-transporting ATPase subunit epsilon
MANHAETGGEEKRLNPARSRLQCVVVTPEKTLFDETVDFVAMPLYDGELGVLPGRSPLIGRLGYGELRTSSEETVKRYFLDGGFAQVRDDVVTILTNRAVPAEDLNPASALADLEKASHTEALTEHDQSEKTKAVARSRAMLRVAKHKS